MSELLKKSLSRFIDTTGEYKESGYSVDDLFTIVERVLQTSESRLCEYVTGYSLEEPELLGRVLKDYQIVRGKYGLPEVSALDKDPAWYEGFLRAIAVQEGVEISNRSDCGSFFTKFPSAAAAYFDENNRAGVTIDKGDYATYIQSLSYLEHEMIHALQFKRTPSMPIEVMEYEAFMAEGDFTNLEQTFVRANGSVMSWYEQLSEKAKKPVVPAWDAADFFIREVDGIACDNLSDVSNTAFELIKQRFEQAAKERQPDMSYEIDLGDIGDMTSPVELRPLG